MWSPYSNKVNTDEIFFKIYHSAPRPANKIEARTRNKGSNKTQEMNISTFSAKCNGASYSKGDNTEFYNEKKYIFITKEQYQYVYNEWIITKSEHLQTFSFRSPSLCFLDPAILSKMSNSDENFTESGERLRFSKNGNDIIETKEKS